MNFAEWKFNFKFRNTYGTAIFLIIFALPFVLVEINLRTGCNWGPLMQFGLPLKDFFTLWVTGFGVIGLITNITINSSRLINQEKQIKLQTKSERNSRFSKAVELLGNPHESARTGAAISLYKLAVEYPDEFKDEVFEILCSHIRTTTSQKEYKKQNSKKPSNEVQTILGLLFCKNSDIGFVFEDLAADLSGSYISGLIIDSAKIKNATLEDVFFHNSTFKNVDFSGAHLTFSKFKECNFHFCEFIGSVMSQTRFLESDFNRCDFSYSFIQGSFFKYNAAFYSPRFDGVTMLHVGFYDVSISGGSFYGANISTGCEFFVCSFDETSFAGSLVDKVGFRLSRLNQISLDCSYCRHVMFSGCDIYKCTAFSAFSGKNDGSINLNDFFKDRTYFLRISKGQKSRFKETLSFNTISTSKLKKLLEMFSINPNWDERITDAFKDQSLGELKDFLIGILNPLEVEKTIKEIKAAEIGWEKWRRNLNNEK